MTAIAKDQAKYMENYYEKLQSWSRLPEGDTSQIHTCLDELEIVVPSDDWLMNLSNIFINFNIIHKFIHFECDTTIIETKISFTSLYLSIILVQTYKLSFWILSTQSIAYLKFYTTIVAGFKWSF